MHSSAGKTAHTAAPKNGFFVLVVRNSLGTEIFIFFSSQLLARTVPIDIIGVCYFSDSSHLTLGPT